MNPRDASSHASMDPNVMVGFAPEGGPHFILSPETPDGSKTYGFEFAIVTTQAMPLAQAADPLPGGFTLTWWEMIGTTQEPESTFPPIWASFLPQTGVNVNELYHSFDVNATALRLQITNVTPVGPGGPGGSVLIMFSEL